MTVFMFDRDYTVDVNPHPNPEKEAVPLKWVKYIAHETNNPVFATGNQHLRREALIPGIEEAREIWAKKFGRDPVDVYEDNSYMGGYKPSRRNGLRLVQDIHPDEEEFIVVDDAHLKDMFEEGIIHYYPWKFVDAVERDKFSIPLDGGNQDNEPENAKDKNIDEHLNESGFYDGYVS